MDYKEITDLIKLINKSDLAEFKLKKDDFEIVIRTKSYNKGDNNLMTPNIVGITTPQLAPQMMPGPPAPVAPVAAAAQGDFVNKNNEAPADESSNLIEIISPIVGTFYRSSSPDKPPFVKVGDTVAVGDTVCIVEAMKLFNEIESEVSGKIVKVMIEDASPVQYDQVLYLVDPKG